MDVNQILTNEIAILIGDNAKEILDTAFFSDDLTSIKASLLEKGISINIIETFLEDWNYDTIQCKSTGITKFAELQNRLAQLTEEPELFNSNGAFIEAHLDSEQKYEGLDVYGKLTEEMLENLKREKNTEYTM